MNDLSIIAATEPSDYLVSRIAKEISKRLLQVQEVFKVKRLSAQLTYRNKRQRVSEGLELIAFETEREDTVKEDMQNYLQLHYTLMLANARAGCSRLPNAPKDAETRDR